MDPATRPVLPSIKASTELPAIPQKRFSPLSACLPTCTRPKVTQNTRTIFGRCSRSSAPICRLRSSFPKAVPLPKSPPHERPDIRRAESGGDHARRSHALQRAPVKPVRSSETILLVEDEASVREITALLLESLGCRVQEASSGEEALHLAQDSREKIDLLMTDVLMPGMSGSELAEVLKASDAGLKVLFLSGHSGDTVVRHGVVHTEVAFLQKPFTLGKTGW